MSFAVIPVNPIGKPRMTRGSVHSPAAKRYWSYKDQVLHYWQALDLPAFPEQGGALEFHLAMPKSWSKKRRMQTQQTPHKQTPDIDNLCKAFLDSILDDDKNIFDIRLTKFWDMVDGAGKIVIVWPKDFV